MRKTIAFIFLYLLCIQNTVASVPWQSMQPLGQSTLKVAFWNIYEAQLFSSAEKFDPQLPHALKLTYLRSFKVDNLVTQTFKEMQRIESIDAQTQSQWETRLLSLWRDVEKGDQLALHIDENQYANFYFNNEFLGIIKDSEFSRLFSAIWLSNKTSRPKLRLALIGQG